MKIGFLISLLAEISIVILWSIPQAYSQGTFANLGFESANVPNLPPGQGGSVSASDGLPGWNVSIGSLIGHNTVSIGGATVCIEGPQYDPNFILFGQYTAYVVGDFNGPNTASIWQTGQVPQTARSLYFISNPSGAVPLFQVTLGSVSIPVTEMGGTTKYTIWAGDISAFAGQTEQLMFTAPPGLGGYLDQITFSPIAIPEPTTEALLSVGGIVLGLRILRRNRLSLPRNTKSDP